jgi:hypothetical protein
MDVKKTKWKDKKYLIPTFEPPEKAEPKETEIIALLVLK